MGLREQGREMKPPFLLGAPGKREQSGLRVNGQNLGLGTIRGV